MKRIFLLLVVLSSASFFSVTRSAELISELSMLRNNLDNLTAVLPKSLSVAEPGLYVMSDVEGDWERVQTFINKSGIFIVRNDDQKNFDIDLIEGATLVFLGDSIDHGKNNVKILLFFIYLKQKYPDNVFLVLGNRDLNKLRLYWELTKDALKLDGEDRFSPDRFRLRRWEGQFNAWKDDEHSALVNRAFVRYAQGNSFDTDRVLKLKWLLTYTMGTGGALDYYKEEMGFASDEQACESYLTYFLELISTYLQLAVILHFDQATGSLFMHGGLSESSLGYIPETVFNGHDAQKLPINSLLDLQHWVTTFNAWAQAKIKAGMDFKNIKNTGGFLAALPLVEYQEPTIIKEEGLSIKWSIKNESSVIRNRPWDASFNLASLDVVLAKKLMEIGVSRILFGHSPVGEVPVILKTNLRAYGLPDFVSVACDTSKNRPARSAVIKVTKNDVTVLADYYLHGLGQSPITLKYNANDPYVGIQHMIKGKEYWSISDNLHAFWTHYGGRSDFGVPTYLWVQE